MRPAGAADGQPRGWIWVAALTMAVVFFLATHDLLAALQWRQTLPEEVRELVREVTEGRMQRRLAFPLLAFIGVIGVISRGRLRFRPDPILGGLLTLFLCWQFLSIAWAADPLLTGKRLIVLAMIVVGAAGFVRQLSVAGLMWATALCTSLHLAAGVATEVWLGTLEPFHPGYRFAGTLHPNQQGINCALLALSAVYLTRAANSPRARALASAALWSALSFLVLTRSRTSLAATLLALLLFLALDARPFRRIVLGTGAATILALWMLFGANGIFPASEQALLLGREDSSLATLTGRTDIWSYALQRATERPIAGYGYNSFWSPRHTAEVSQVVDWKISEGHSAYLDTLLNVGAVGLLLYLGLLSLAMVAAFARHRRSRDPAFAVAAAIVAFGALDGLLESAMVLPNLPSFVSLAVIGAIACGGEPDPGIGLVPAESSEPARVAA